MKQLVFILISSLLSTVYGQQCIGKFNETVVGQCSSIDNCQGTLLYSDSCAGEQQRCCATETITSLTCLTNKDFGVLYNTVRGIFIQEVLNRAINTAGICSNCYAKAAFLAVAATMTSNFTTDEAAGNITQFTSDDTKYGNSQLGDGLRFRRRGLFGLRGRTMYQRLQSSLPQYLVATYPNLAADTDVAIAIAAQLWNYPDLLRGPSLTQYADGTYYGFSMLWYKLTESIEILSDGVNYYSKFLRLLNCSNSLTMGQGSTCQYNDTNGIVQGVCAADCIAGLDSGDYCGCSGTKGSQCPNSPVHIRCCSDTCSQELKMDVGFVLDASGSIGASNYVLQQQFVRNLLSQLNVGPNATHVGIINFSGSVEILTWLNRNYSLVEKVQAVNNATYFGGGTDTALGLQTANTVFSLENGLRQPQEGAIRVIFIITDGASNDQNATLQAASVLKQKSIQLISVGVGSNLNTIELQAMCTQPASENYFSIADYTALNEKLNLFTSKSCTEPVPISTNLTVTVEVSKDKYKFFKLTSDANSSEINITVSLLNGNVTLFYSFSSINPKDPTDFVDYESITKSTKRSLFTKSTSYLNNAVSLTINKLETDSKYVYIGIKGVESNNKFEVAYAVKQVTSSPSSSSANMLLFTGYFTINVVFMHIFLFH